MGLNMTRRLLRRGNAVVANDVDEHESTTPSLKAPKVPPPRMKSWMPSRPPRTPNL